jgi:hypothetical protein
MERERQKNDGTRATESYLLVTGARFVPNSTRDTAQTALSLSPPRSLTSAKFNVLPLVCSSSCPPSFVPHFLAIARAIARAESSRFITLLAFCLFVVLFFYFSLFKCSVLTPLTLVGDGNVVKYVIFCQIYFQYFIRNFN